MLAGCLVFLAGLALFAYAGSFTRFWADDYCYSAIALQHGLLGGLVEWYLHSGNRFSALASVAVADLFGGLNVAFLPGLLLALWVFACAFFLDSLFYHLLQRPASRLWCLLFGLAQVFYSALLAPDRLQAIYWRMGILHYALPLPVLLLALGWTVRGITRPGRPGLLLASGAAAFFAAGQSETYAMLQLGVFGVGLLAAQVILRGERSGRAAPRERAALWLGVPLLSTLAVLALMFLSPSLSVRLAVMPAPTNLWLVFSYSLRYAADFVFYSLRGQVVPYAAYGLSMAALGLLAGQGPGLSRPLSPRAALLGMGLSLALAYALIAFSFTPSAYANLQYPAGRALMPAGFVLLVGLAGFAFFGSALARLLLARAAGPGRLRLAGLALLCVLCLYPLRAARAPLADARLQSTWAARWDARDAQIRQARSAGVRDIVVKQVEVIHTLEDLGPNPRHWINNCASIYYGVRSITANP
jgi:hypothetical protein